MSTGETEAPDSGKSGKSVASLQERVAAWRLKWPIQVRKLKPGVFEGYRQMVLPTRRFRYEWRSLKGKGFWVTAKDFPVFHGKTLAEATIKLAETLLEMQ